MTISSDLNRWSYPNNTDVSSFVYGNKIFAETDLKVYIDSVLQTVNTDYTVSGIGSEAGGSIVLTAPPAGSFSVVIVRDVPKTQGTDLPFGGVFPAASVEDVFDKITVLAQQNSDRIDRALVLADTDTGSIGAMPLLSTFFNKYIAFDGDGNPTPGVSLTDQSVTYTVNSLSGDNSTVAFTLSVAPASTEATSVFISGVRQVPVTDYSVSGTTLTFTSPPPTGTDNIFVLASQSFTGVPSDGSVTAAKIVADAVDWVTKVKAATAGDIPYFDGAGDPALLALGSDDEVLTLSGGIPSWAAPPSQGFASGTKMLFQQETAPTGWTKDTTHNDKALRVVTGTPGSGGATAFATVFGSGKTSGSTAPSNASHSHSVSVAAGSAWSFGGPGSFGSGSTGNSGGGSSHTHTVSLDLQYVDIIIATKD